MSRSKENKNGSRNSFEDDFDLVFKEEIDGKSTYDPKNDSTTIDKKLSVTFAKLAYIDQTLRLTVKGKNLTSVKLNQCMFDFGFEIGGSDTKIIKNSANILVLEQFTPGFSANVPEYGCQIRIETVSGQAAEYLVTEFEGIKKRSVNELAKDDDVLLVLDAAFKRAVDLLCINENPMKVPLICNLVVLAHLLLSEPDYDELLKLFLDDGEKLKINDKKNDRLNELVRILSENLTSAIELKTKRSTGEKAAIVLGSVVLSAAAAAGAIFAVGATVAGEVAAGTAVVSAADQKLAKAVVVGAASLAATVTETTLDHFNNKTIMKANYKTILDYLVSELKSRNDHPSIEGLDSLLTSECVFMKEKALLMLFDTSLDNMHQNFKGCMLDQCIEESKRLLVQRILSIKQVHKIRDILANQCFIGIVGPQNAGKSSLIKSIWGCDVIVGQFKHTTETTAFQVTDNVMIVDYPGSTSLDDYRKAFSRSGSMNNILVAVIQYQGAPDQITCSSLQEIYATVQKSKGMKVLLCFNQCGKSYDDLIEENVSIEDMKERYVDQLNNYLKLETGSSGSQSGNIFRKDDIRFTDWKANGEQRKFGILGIVDIKWELKLALKELHIIDKGELDFAIPN